MSDAIYADIDFAFAEEQAADLPTQAAKLRYIVAINPDMTMETWLEIADKEGWHLGTARNRFNESRKLSKEMDEADGSV